MISYRCDHCGQTYKSEESARACEFVCAVKNVCEHKWKYSIEDFGGAAFPDINRRCDKCQTIEFKEVSKLPEFSQQKMAELWEFLGDE